MSLEPVHHRQAPGLSVCGAQPSQSVMQNETQNGDAETEGPKPAHHHHQDLFSS